MVCLYSMINQYHSVYGLFVFHHISIPPCILFVCIPTYIRTTLYMVCLYSNIYQYHPVYGLFVFHDISVPPCIWFVCIPSYISTTLYMVCLYSMIYQYHPVYVCLYSIIYLLGYRTIALVYSALFTNDIHDTNNNKHMHNPFLK